MNKYITETLGYIQIFVTPNSYFSDTLLKDIYVCFSFFGTNYLPDRKCIFPKKISDTKNTKFRRQN